MPHLTGNCLCGQISYKADGEIGMQGNCHCTDCKQVTGATFATYVFMQKANVKITGEASSFDHKADSGAVLTKNFCPTCGSTVYSSHDGRPEMIGLLAGTINEHEHVKPQFNVYTCRKMDCTPMDETIPAFEKLPG